LDGEVLRHRARGEGRERGAADAGCGGLHEGPHDPAVLPRPEAPHDRGGPVADPAGADREWCVAGRPLVGLTDALDRLLHGTELPPELARECLTTILSGEATDAQIAGFAVALRAKGETPAELAALVSTMLDFAERVEVADPSHLIDTCGTGGDRAGTVNVSTMAALVAAGAGARVAKHGNRAASSQCGSADVLESLGVVIDLPPAGVA